MGAYDLTTVSKARLYMRMTDADIERDALSVYCDATDATAATAEVQYSDTYAHNLRLVITDGTDAGTTDIDLDAANSDTALGLASTVNDLSGWSCTLLGSGDYRASDLSKREAAGCLSSDNELTLKVEDVKLVEMLVEQATSIIEGEVGYGIKARDYSEIYDGPPGKYLWLDNVPVIRVDGVFVWRDEAATVKFTGTAGYATVETTGNSVRVRSNDGSWTTNELVLSDYSTISDIVAGIDALAGWSATSVDSFSGYPASFLVRLPAQDANDKWVELEVPDAPDVNVELADPDTGRIYNPFGWSGYWARHTIFPGNRGVANVVIKYRAGYETVPADLESACLELVKLLYDMSARDASLKAEKIGDYSWSASERTGAIFSSTGSEGQANSIRLKIQPYTRKLVRGI